MIFSQAFSVRDLKNIQMFCRQESVKGVSIEDIPEMIEKDLIERGKIIESSLTMRAKLCPDCGSTLRTCSRSPGIAFCKCSYSVPIEGI